MRHRALSAVHRGRPAGRLPCWPTALLPLAGAASGTRSQRENRPARWPFGLSLAILLTAGPCAADSTIYQWTDAAGVVHFSDTPPAPTPLSAAAAETVETAETGEAMLAAPGESAAAESEADARTARTARQTDSQADEVRDGVGYLSPISGHVSDDEPIEAFAGGSATVVDATTTARNTTAPVADDLPPVFTDAYGSFRIGEPIDDARAPRSERCAAARRDLALLSESWPVYRIPGGELRFQWARDPWRGQRAYLDAEARKLALISARQRSARECDGDTSPGDTVSRNHLMQAALCEAEQAEYAAMRERGDVFPTEDMTRKALLVGQVCSSLPAD